MARKSKRSIGKKGGYNAAILAVLVIALLVGVSYGVYEVYLKVTPPAEYFQSFLLIRAPIVDQYSGTVSSQLFHFPIPDNIGRSVPGGIWNSHDYDTDGYLPGYYPLYTTDTTGTITVESKVARSYTLGDFFNVWGKTLNSTQVLSLKNGSENCPSCIWMMWVMDGAGHNQTSTEFQRHVIQSNEIVSLTYG